MACRHAAGRRPRTHPGGRCKPLGRGGDTPSPTPIEVSGQAQVFKDKYCSVYVDDTLNAPKLWVRINKYVADGWPYIDNNGGDIVLRKSAGVLDLYDTVTSAVIYRSNVQPPFTAGQVIECSRVAKQTKIIRNVYYYNGD